jgi:hypothetical protein
MMHGDDAPLDRLKKEVDDLRREVQEAFAAQAHKINYLTDRQGQLDGRLNSLNTMIEDRQQH